LRGLRLQYETATGRDDFNTKLAPGTRKFFGDQGTNKKSDQDSGGGHPPGNYNYDPATGNLEPVK
jgi:hypothetical protein